MSYPTKDKTAERLAIGIVTIFLVGFGWLNLLQGGISLKSKSGHVGYATGNFGIAVACGTFIFAALGALLLAKSFNLKARGMFVLIGLITLPPIIFLLW
jgi:uncharacterized membrane protein YdfJ with MMPL/SSD domain